MDADQRCASNEVIGKLSTELFLRQMLPAKETREREPNTAAKAVQKSPCL